jgi:hypothetical protein
MVPFRRLMAGLSAANFDFVTIVPGSKAEQGALVQLLTLALDGLPGPWKVGVCRGTVVSWIILSIFRDDGFECSLFLDEPMKQTALFIREQLLDALRLQEIQPPGAVSSAVKQGVD